MRNPGRRRAWWVGCGSLMLAGIHGLAGVAPEPAVAPPPAVPVVLVRSVATPPLVDGSGLDDAWRAGEGVNLAGPDAADGARVTVKACSDGLRLYLLVSFPAKKERRRHRPWHWDPTAQHYRSGEEQEQTLTIIFQGAGGMADLWLWRADRTDAAGHADDGWFMPGNGFRADAGSPCWESRYVADFAGVQLPRFYPREPSGSLADVRARGVWERERWTVELSRPLDSEHADDLPLAPGAAVGMQIFAGLPGADLEPPTMVLQLPSPPIQAATEKQP